MAVSWLINGDYYLLSKWDDPPSRGPPWIFPKPELFRLFGGEIPSLFTTLSGGIPGGEWSQWRPDPSTKTGWSIGPKKHPVWPELVVLVWLDPNILSHRIHGTYVFTCNFHKNQPFVCKYTNPIGSYHGIYVKHWTSGGLLPRKNMFLASLCFASHPRYSCFASEICSCENEMPHSDRNKKKLGPPENVVDSGCKFQLYTL